MSLETHGGMRMALVDGSRESFSIDAIPAAPARDGGRRAWAIILAGGEGRRLRPLVQRLCGDDRPKQYVRLLGARTLLRQTLDRTELAIPLERTLVVTMSRHAGYLAEEFPGRERPHMLVQPGDRGTAAAVAYAAHWVGWRDPGAIVAIFPSDHFVPAAARFMAHVAEVAAWVERRPDRIVLLGAAPVTPEVQYGWIEPGEPLGEVTTGPVRAVRQFREKPSLERARTYLAAGHLWNTSVIVAKAAALIEAVSRATPVVGERVARLRCFAGTPDEEAAAHQAYLLMPKASLSRAVFAACPDALAVSQLPRLVWSDLGSPRRVIDTLCRLGIGAASIHDALAAGVPRKEVTACR